MYSGSSWKDFVMILLPAIFSACSSVGSKTFLVVKLRLQKYGHGMLTVTMSPSNMFFFSSFSLLVLRHSIRGCWALEILVIGKMTLSLKYWAYLPILYLSSSSGHFCWTFKEADVVEGLWLFSFGFSWKSIGLEAVSFYFFIEGAVWDGQLFSTVLLRKAVLLL